MPSARAVSITLPAVPAREHQVEHARVGALEAQAAPAPARPCRPTTASKPPRSRCRAIAFGDDVVVLDDQHPGHGRYDRSAPSTGDDLATSGDAFRRPPRRGSELEAASCATTSSRRAARSSSCSTMTRRVVAASRRARESLDGLEEGVPFPEALPARAGGARSRSRTPSTGTRRRSSTSARPATLAAYEELRAGFTAAVSHELRTPLARLLALLESGDAAGRRPRTPDRRGARARSSASAS